MSSVGKTSSTKVSIIRKSDYSRKDVEPVLEIGISNKDSQLDNNTFGDLIIQSEEKDKKKKKIKEVYNRYYNI